eukprot:1958712-Amphidinium_carterae.1
MKCRLCGRFVTTCKGTWRNLGTLRKPCKPKKPKEGKAGKAPHQQKVGPCLPFLRDLLREASRKAPAKSHPVRETLDSLQEQIHADYGTAEASDNVHLVTAANASSSSTTRRPTEASVVHRMVAAPLGSKRGLSAASNIAAELLVCFQCLPVV